MKFGFRDLDVWKKSVELANSVIAIAGKIKTDRKHYRLIENLESAAVSIATNIAEGKGRYSKREFVQFLYIARGSLYETATLLEIFKKRNWIDNSGYEKLIKDTEEITKMLMGLINSIRRQT